MDIQKKYLIIFDFDQTIIDKDSEFSLIEKYTPEFYKEHESELYKCENWISFNNEIYRKMKEKGYNWEFIKKYYENLKLSSKMDLLFQFILEHKNNIDSIICTGNNNIVVNTVLKKHNLDKIITYIISNKSILDEENILKISLLNEKYQHCKECFPFLCKQLAIEDFFEKNKREKYDKIIFICDGGNDICFSKHLNKGDLLFPRIGFTLCHLLFDENKKDIIKANIYPWENAEQIIDVLKKLEF